MILPNINPHNPEEIALGFRLLDEKLSEIYGVHGKHNFRTVPDSQEQASLDEELLRYDQMATGFVPTTRNVIAGAGLAGGGDLTMDRTFSVGDGDGINILANSIEVDEGVGLTFAAGVLVVDQAYDFNWTGDQTWAGTATFNNTVSIASGMNFPDNIPLYFGTANDSSILYNGTDMIIDPNLVGTGIVDIQGDCDADKYTVTYTTARTAHNNIETNVTIAGTGFDLGTTYQGLVVDVSYAFNDAAGASTARLNGIYMDFDVTNAAASAFLPTMRAMFFDVDIGANVSYGTSPRMFSFDVNSLSTDNMGPSSGVFHVGVTAPTDDGIACYTSMTSTAVASSAGLIAGYEGYANGSLTYTGKIAGVYGFTAYTRDAYGTYGVVGYPSGAGTSCSANRTVGLMANTGSIVAANGNLIIQTGGAIWLRPVDITPTHLNFANAGQAWIASGLEVDGVAYFDNATTAIQIGSGAAGVDYRILVDGESSDGILTWMEDEDYWQFADDVMIPTNERIYFGDTASSIRYDATQINFNDDTNIILSSPIVTVGNAAAGVDILLKFDGQTTDGYLYWREDEAWFEFGDDVMMADSQNIIFDTTTGSKIGTAANQKIGFWGAAPVVQRSHIVDADAGTIVAQFNTLLSYLETIGILASA